MTLSESHQCVCTFPGDFVSRHPGFLEIRALKTRHRLSQMISCQCVVCSLAPISPSNGVGIFYS